MCRRRTRSDIRAPDSQTRGRCGRRGRSARCHNDLCRRTNTYLLKHVSDGSCVCVWRSKSARMERISARIDCVSSRVFPFIYTVLFGNSASSSMDAFFKRLGSDRQHSRPILPSDFDGSLGFEVITVGRTSGSSADPNRGGSVTRFTGIDPVTIIGSFM